MIGAYRGYFAPGYWIWKEMNGDTTVPLSGMRIFFVASVFPAPLSPEMMMDLKLTGTVWVAWGVWKISRRD